MKAPARGRSVVRIEISPRSIALILATIAGVWLAYRLRMVELTLVMAQILVGTLNPLIEWMERRSLRRTHALILVLAASSVVAALLLLATLPPLVAQLAEMVKDAPATRARLITLLEARSFTIPLAHIVRDAGLEQLFTRVEQYLVGYSSETVRVVAYAATTVVLSFYLLADGGRAATTSH